LKVPDKISFKALSQYAGAWRRFEIKKGEINEKKFTIISDYAHHPTEVKATLEAARERFPNKEIWCVFQPHQYQRTFYLFNDFVRVFSKLLRRTQGKLLRRAQGKPALDKLIITDIYDVTGREKKQIREKINSRKLIKKINKSEAIYLPKGKIKNHLKRNLKDGEVVIIMGAGDIYELSEQWRAKPRPLI